MPTITNPIIRGFNPDPSILRVGDDYYIATSSFEWLPAVPLYHSTDLVHWRLLGHAFEGGAPFDLRGVMDSAGIWAPSLSWCDGLFHLVYTVVRTRTGNYKDVHNYLVTARDPRGPWSAPVYLNASGFDPSLFHDDDGRKWLVNIQWDFRKGKPRFAGILLQEFDAAKGRLVGKAEIILQKETLIEGPNLYRRNGWYYLLLAEGGTGWNHSISVARSRSLRGPYELDPQAVLLTARDDYGLSLQKAGHGELVQAQDGGWYLAHLCSRPVGPNRRCVLGRETALQKVRWTEDGWLRLETGGYHPAVNLPAPEGLRPSPGEEIRFFDDFDGPTLKAEWSTLRVPAETSWLSLSERPGWLCLRGRESLSSLFEQSLVGVRLRSIKSQVETRIEFTPDHFSQRAGLVCYYDTRTHYHLHVQLDDAGRRCVGLSWMDDGTYDEATGASLCTEGWPETHLRAEFSGSALRFFASRDANNWIQIGPDLDATKLSDDYGQGLHFTGAFVALAAQDLGGARTPAYFSHFVIEAL